MPATALVIKFFFLVPWFRFVIYRCGIPDFFGTPLTKSAQTSRNTPTGRSRWSNMLGEGKPQKPAPMTASSQEIERHAMYGLAELANIIGSHTG